MTSLDPTAAMGVGSVSAPERPSGVGERFTGEMSGALRASLLVAWIALVYPLTWLGYGSDGDAWLVAETAEQMWTRREYIASRTTGFPLFELSATPAVHVGEWYASNLIAMIGGLAVLGALSRLASNGEFRRPLLVVLGIAFCPIIIKNSSVTMDYLPALAAMTWAYAMLREDRLTACGLLIGLACGFRPSSGLFVIPCALYVLLQRRALAPAIRLGITAFVAGIVAYSPSLIKYGVRSPMSAIHLDARTMVLIGGYNITQLFGILATLALIAAYALGLYQCARLRPEVVRSPRFVLHVSNILLWLGLFTLIPEETEYLLPLLPSVVILLDMLVPPRIAVVVTALILLQHVIAFDVLGGTSGDRQIDPGFRAGFTIADIQDRRFKLSTREAAARYRATTPTVLMLGYAWIPSRSDAWTWDTTYDLARQTDGQLFVSSPIRDEATLRRLKADGFRLVVWDGAKWQYTRTSDVDWERYVELVTDLDRFFGEHIVGHPVH